MPAKRKHNVENAAEISFTERRVEKAAVLDRIQLLAQEVMHLTPLVALSHSIEYYRFMALKATNDTDGLPSKLAPSALAYTPFGHSIVCSARESLTPERRQIAS